MNDEDAASRTTEDNPLRWAEHNARILHDADAEAASRGRDEELSAAPTEAPEAGGGSGYLDRLARQADALLEPRRPPRE